MNKVFLLLFGALAFTGATAQNLVQEGEVTYETAAHLYVQWENAEPFSGADSLLLNGVAHFIVAQSSRSVVLEKGAISFQVGERVTLAPWGTTESDPVVPTLAESAVEEVLEDTDRAAEASQPNANRAPRERKNFSHGRAGTSVLANFDNGSALLRTSHRLDLGTQWSSGSTVQQIEVRGTLRQYSTSKDVFWRRNLFQASYNLQTPRVEAEVGRFVPKFAGALGAMDGARVSYKGPLSLHVMGGFRPDYTNYSLQMDQPLYGVFASTPRALGAAKLYVTYFE